MADRSSLRDLMVKTKVAALVRPGGAHAVATLSPDATVEQALATLAGHKVLSAPIVGADKVRRVGVGEEEQKGGWGWG